MRALETLGTGLLVSVLLSFPACSSSHSSTPPPPPPVAAHWTEGGSTQLNGTLSSATATGTMTWTVAATFVPATGSVSGDMTARALRLHTLASTSVAVTGSATLGGVTITLSNGQFDPTTLVASVDGSDGTNTYHFAGMGTANGLVGGTYTVNGIAAGTWSVLFVPESGNVTVYAGTYQNTAGVSDTGYFNLEISSSGQVSGNYASNTNGGGGYLNGTATAVDATHGTFSADILDGSTKIGTVAATSTYTFAASPTAMVQGTYSATTNQGTVSGTFTGHN